MARNASKVPLAIHPTVVRACGLVQLDANPLARPEGGRAYELHSALALPEDHHLLSQSDLLSHLARRSVGSERLASGQEQINNQQHLRGILNSTRRSFPKLPALIESEA